MQQFVTTITQRGQITIPAEVRRRLGLGPRDKVAFEIEGDQVRLVPALFTLEAAYGSVQPHAQPEDFDAISRAGKEAHAARVLDKLRQR
jgi:AbrB family looped-hinge helix DNA binding protein